jgi:hypothetical protein
MKLLCSAPETAMMKLVKSSSQIASQFQPLEKLARQDEQIDPVAAKKINGLEFDERSKLFSVIGIIDKTIGEARMDLLIHLENEARKFNRTTL